MGVEILAQSLVRVFRRFSGVTAPRSEGRQRGDAIARLEGGLGPAPRSVEHFTDVSRVPAINIGNRDRHGSRPLEPKVNLGHLIACRREVLRVLCISPVVGRRPAFGTDPPHAPSTQQSTQITVTATPSYAGNQLRNACTANEAGLTWGNRRATRTRATTALRFKHPDLSDEQVLKKVDTTFTSAVTTTGAATGAMAAAPGVGTAAGLVAVAVDTSWFLETAQGHSDYPRFSDNGIPRTTNYDIAIRRSEATAHATPPDSVPY